MFQNVSNFYIKFKTCISYPISCYLNLKPFKNISKIFQRSKTSLYSVSGLYSRPDRSTGTISGQIGRPGLVVLGVHVCACLPVDRQTLRSTDCITLTLGFCRSTSSSILCFNIAGSRPGGRLEPTALLAKWLAGRLAGRPAAVQNAPPAIFWICFVF